MGEKVIPQIPFKSLPFDLKPMSVLKFETPLLWGLDCTYSSTLVMILKKHLYKVTLLLCSRKKDLAYPDTTYNSKSPEPVKIFLDPFQFNGVLPIAV